MRVAWLGPTPTDVSGSAYAGTQMLLALAELGVEIDCFTAARTEEISIAVRRDPRIEIVQVPSWWRWGRWYSRTRTLAMVSGLASRVQAQYRLVADIAMRHHQEPYDVVYQFAQTELLALGRYRDVLPPIVLHPGTHAAGELRWLWRERRLSRRSGEPVAQKALVMAILAMRAVIQRRDVRRAAFTVAISRHFAAHLIDDYGLNENALRVVPHVIDLDRFRPVPSPSETTRLQVLCPSGPAVRKGFETLVELSDRLDLAGSDVVLNVTGHSRQWSDYTPLVEDLNRRTAKWLGPLTAAELALLYRVSAVMIQPSRYEPFGLTVAEALASGVPVIASDEVGAAEEVDQRCCRRFISGDAADLERCLTELLADLAGPDGAAIRGLARSEAERLFSPSSAGERFAQALEAASNGSNGRG